VTCLDATQSTPAPWINVVANRVFGFQIATEGSGYTWSINSRENQITQWSNDPVTDRPGEVLYVRDDDTGDLWGPTISPIRSTSAPFSVRHGQGYSRFEHNAHGIALDLVVYVPLDDPIKICRLKIRNTSQRRRRLTVTAYVEWVPVRQCCSSAICCNGWFPDRHDIRVIHGTSYSARVSLLPTSGGGKPIGPVIGESFWDGMEDWINPLLSRGKQRSRNARAQASIRAVHCRHR
jgi:hypothetical protein